MRNLNYLIKVCLVRLSLISLILFIVYSCRDNLVERKIELANRLLSTDPDSSLAILQTIDINKIVNESLKANFSLLYSIALDKNYIDLTNDSIIAFAHKYYTKRESKLDKAKLFYYLARIRINSNSKEEAVKMLLLARDNATDIKDLYLKALINNTLANQYFEQKDYIKAIELYKNCVHLYGNNLHNIAGIYSSLAKTSYLIGNDSLASYYFRKANSIYFTLKDSSNLLNNLSSVVVLSLNSDKKIKDVITQLKSNYSVFNNSKIPIRHYPLLANLYLRQHNIDSARHYALSYLNLNKNDISHKSSILAQLCEIEKEACNFKLALQYNEQLFNLFSEIHTQENIKHIQNIEQEFDNKKLKEDKLNLEKEKLFLNIILSLFFIVSILILFIVYISWRNKLKLAKIKLEEQDIIIADLNATVTSLNIEYLDVKKALDIEDALENKFINAFECRIQGLNSLMEIAYINETNPNYFFEKFKIYMRYTSDKSDNFADIRYIANKRSNGFIDFLAKSYPQLNSSDLDFCAMICMNFSVNSIRFIFGHTNIVSVFNKRKKLREKLAINKNITIEKFMQELQMSQSKQYNL